MWRVREDMLKIFPAKNRPKSTTRKIEYRLTKFSKPQTKKNIINNNAMMNDNEENYADATVPLSEVTHQGNDDSLTLSSAASCSTASCSEQPKKVSPNRHCWRLKIMP